MSPLSEPKGRPFFKFSARLNQVSLSITPSPEEEKGKEDQESARREWVYALRAALFPVSPTTPCTHITFICSSSCRWHRVCVSPPIGSTGSLGAPSALLIIERWDRCICTRTVETDLVTARTRERCGLCEGVWFGEKDLTRTLDHRVTARGTGIRDAQVDTALT